MSSSSSSSSSSSPSFTKGQSWGALKKAWRAYKIAKVKNDKQKMMEYAVRIRNLQKDLGVTQAKFPELNLE